VCGHKNILSLNQTQKGSGRHVGFWSATKISNKIIKGSI
jgi:hypothetical protein